MTPQGISEGDYIDCTVCIDCPKIIGLPSRPKRSLRPNRSRFEEYGFELIPINKYQVPPWSSLCPRP